MVIHYKHSIYFEYLYSFELTTQDSIIATNSAIRESMMPNARLINIAVLMLLFLIFGSPPTFAAALIKNGCKEGRLFEECSANSGIEYIYIYDEIDQQTAHIIADTAGLIPVTKKFPKVYLNSYGGSSRYARQIGRILRTRNAEVEGKDIISPDKQSVCLSACVEIAAGATKRNLFEIGVHRGSWKQRTKGDNYKYDIMSDEDMKSIYDYYREMGISEDLIKLMQYSDVGEMIKISFHPDLSYKNQKLVELGFLMREPSDEELEKIKNDIRNVDFNGNDVYFKQASNGDKDAALVIGSRYLNGSDGVTKNIAKGLMWLNRAADLGNPSACHALGIIYRDATPDIKQDLKLAFKYFLKGARLGFSGSQNNVGWAYYKGEGTEKNLYEAIYWITKAAEQGEPFGYGSLAEIRFKEAAFAQDDVETLKFYILATRGLPKGQALDHDTKNMNTLKWRMTGEQQKAALKLADEWHPIKNNGPTMLDKDDR